MGLKTLRSTGSESNCFEENTSAPTPGPNERYTMNILLWVQRIAALLYGASGAMKVFMFDKVSGQVPSFGALPREARMALGILELICVVGLIVPAAFRWLPTLTVGAATVLAITSIVFIGVHVKILRKPIC